VCLDLFARNVTRRHKLVPDVLPQIQLLAYRLDMVFSPVLIVLLALSRYAEFQDVTDASFCRWTQMM